MMKLQILGCHAATPRSNSFATSQVLEIDGQMVLIDCAEGTQIQLRRQKVKFSRIKHIFISHLHGDHFFGLIGLLNTFSLQSRKEELHVYGPKGIKKITLLQQKYGNAWTSYPLRFHELDQKSPEVIFDDEKMSVETIPLDHRVYTNGFLFREKTKDRKLLIDKAQRYKIDKAYYKRIKKGYDFTLASGETIPNEELTEAPETPKSYAFCSDTCYQPEMVEQLKGVDYLYHESTFLEKHSDLCEKTKHSTAKEAAVIAKRAEVKELILGHFSARYKDKEDYRTEAREIFEPVSLARDGKIFNWT